MTFSYNDLKKEFNLFSDGDHWGETMHWWFAAAEEIYLNRDQLEVPEDWRYHQSPLGAVNDPEDYATVAVQGSNDEDLMRFGMLLNRRARLLDHLGYSY